MFLIKANFYCKCKYSEDGLNVRVWQREEINNLFNELGFIIFDYYLLRNPILHGTKYEHQHFYLLDCKKNLDKLAENLTKLEEISIIYVDFWEIKLLMGKDSIPVGVKTMERFNSIKISSGLWNEIKHESWLKDWGGKEWPCKLDEIREKKKMDKARIWFGKLVGLVNN